ncbi:MAG: nitrogen fixation protein NifZ [Gammaproteobacteria bacterium]|nr:nitrogen fixation protein NifZ [Gammaproteobacteria bacterium]
MIPKYQYGDAVRVTRNIRNDGTYPGRDKGELLIRRGSVGYVRDVGTFLQDQLIYTVDYMESGLMVGCREQELQPESDPWIPTRFEFHDRVTPTVTLAVDGEVIASPGDGGEIEKVLREEEGGPLYHVRFNGRVLLVAENSLEPLAREERV